MGPCSRDRFYHTFPVASDTACLLRDIKDNAGQVKTKLSGVARGGFAFTFAAAADDRVRLPKLLVPA
jgi:hypothetical protein